MQNTDAYVPPGPDTYITLVGQTFRNPRLAL